MRVIRVRHGQHHRRFYKVAIGKGILGRLPDLLARSARGRSVFILSDANVSRLYGRSLQGALEACGVTAALLAFPPGERSKNRETVHTLHTGLIERGVRRNSLIVALGGGVVGDIAGFVAATILRGITYIQVPTTLLSQADSCIGGKVGIDHPLGKNLIGAFHHPEAVYIDPGVLSTLPDGEFRNGLAEVVKIAAALDDRFFRYIERHARRIVKTATDVLSELIVRSIGLKAAVIRKDEHDAGLRKVLNLGHTLGHALEASMKYSISHGRAVAIGLAAESKIAMAMGLLKARDYARLMSLLHEAKLPTRFPRLPDRTAFLSALGADKKAEGCSPEFVLLKGIGRSVIGVNVPASFITQLLG